MERRGDEPAEEPQKVADDLPSSRAQQPEAVFAGHWQGAGCSSWRRRRCWRGAFRTGTRGAAGAHDPGEPAAGGEKSPTITAISGCR